VTTSAGLSSAMKCPLVTVRCSRSGAPVGLVVRHVDVGRGDRDRTGQLYDQLLPAAGELAGAGSGLVTLGPVAQHLGELAAALGRPEQAREHLRQALAVAERAGAAHWARAAQERLAGLR
jgi:hypothetical protein